MSREQLVRNTAPFIYSAALLDDGERYERAIQATVDNPYTQQDHAFIRQVQAILAWDATSRSNGIKSSTLVVTNSDDILVPPRNGEKLSKLISGAKLVSLDGGHAGVTEAPHEHNTAFLEFLGAAVPA